nr:hypothetical protein [Cytophagales bacterium]
MKYPYYRKRTMLFSGILLCVLASGHTHGQSKIKVSSNHADAVYAKVDDVTDEPIERLGIGAVDFKLDKESKNRLLVTKEGYEPLLLEFPKTVKWDKEFVALLENRLVVLETDHEDAMIFCDDIHMGNGKANIIVPKGKSVSVFVNKNGFVTQTLSFYNQPDQEEPPIKKTISLKDRLVTLEIVPSGAMVTVGGSEPDPNTNKIVVPFDTCVEVKISKEGFADVVKEFCNIPGSSPVPPITQKITLEDRIVKLTVTPEDASISMNGTLEAYGTFDMLVAKGKCQRILIQKEGFIPFSKTYCNQNDAEIPPALENLILREDEAYNASVATEKVNTRIPLVTRNSLSSADAWKILIAIITREFDVLETVDYNAGYLITGWKYDEFNESTYAVRSRVIVTNTGNTSENSYSVKIISQYGMGKASELDETKYKDWNRLLKKYYAVLDEVEIRLQ